MSEVPFRDDLIPGSFENPRLKEFQHNPTKVVRQYWLRSVDEDPDNRQEALAAELEKFYATKKELIRLTGAHGLQVVPHEMIVGKDDQDRTVLYTMTEKIPGLSLEKQLASPEHVPAKELDAFYGKLIHYLDDKNNTRQPFCGDIFQNGQFVYRPDLPDGQDRIWLVDVDPFFRHPAEQGAVRDVLMSLWEITWMISDAESNIGQQLEQSRQKVRELFEKFPDPSPMEKRSWEAIQKFLSEPEPTGREQ